MLSVTMANIHGTVVAVPVSSHVSRPDSEPTVPMSRAESGLSRTLNEVEIERQVVALAGLELGAFPVAPARLAGPAAMENDR